ncbi:cupin domain-containing protein [Kitasatospora sp. NPDC091207]|uniref:cupin domain-containing protein n=1 Tax=Kitasatospora sp. NPDC091207 TaxID=3364083 RepID=UPI0038049510
MNAAPPKPVLTRAAIAEATSDPSSVITPLADRGSDGNPITSYRPTLAKDTVDAPAHLHTRASELFFVIGGTLQVLVKDKIEALGAGDFLPPGHTPPAFAAPDSETDVLFVLTPDMPRLDYPRLLGRVTRREASPQEIKNSSEQYDNHYIDSPLRRATLETAAAARPPGPASPTSGDPITGGYSSTLRRPTRPDPIRSDPTAAPAAATAVGC